jgi:hypothetical protein
MKNKESFSGSEPKREEGVRLTPEQKSNNPNGFWESFLKQATNRLLRDLESGGIYDRRSTEKTSLKQDEPKIQKVIIDDIKEVLGDIPRGLKNFTSEEDLLLLALLRYRDDHGFVNGSDMETEYKKLRKAKMEKRALQILEKLRGEEEEYDFDTVPIEEEVAKLVEEEPDINQSEVETFRQNLWGGFSNMKIQ